MTIDNFEKFIDPIILERGEDYYFDGNVMNIEKITPDKWRAKVEGTEIYNVEIMLKNNEIIETYCDCPYDMGEFCKHQVASFLKLRDYLSKNDVLVNDKKNNKLSRVERLDQILSKIDKVDLIKFIKEKALSDDILYTSIISVFDLNNNNIDKSEYYNIIKSHLNHAKDRHGFIDYYHASYSIKGADTILNQAKEAIDNKNYATAIKMAQSVVEIMIPSLQEVDDSDGFFGTVIDEGFDILFECSQSDLNEKTRKEFFEYSLNEMNKKKYDGWSDWKLNFFYIAENLAKDKIELDKIIEIIDSSDIEESSYLFENLLLLKYNILVTLGDLKKAERFFQNNLHLPDFRKIAIENSLLQKDYLKAEKLALEGEKINIEYPGLVNNWKEYRLRIYEETKNINKQRDILKEFTLKKDFDSYLKLKNTYKKNEWQSVYCEIINKIKNKYSNYSSQFLMEIYVEENLLKELLNEIKKQPSHIEEYDKILIKDFSSDVYDLYKKYLMNKVKYASNRSNYQDLCNIIRRLIKIGGNNTAKGIIDYLQIEYKKRPAFMDELSKIKFK